MKINHPMPSSSRLSTFDKRNMSVKVVPSSGGSPERVSPARRSVDPVTDFSIILDLDETLIHTMDEGTQQLESLILNGPQHVALRGRLFHITIDDLFEKRGKGTRSDYWGVKRPHLNYFLGFCFSYFKVVAVWSAGKKPYVDAVVRSIFDGIGTPHIVYSYDEVVSSSSDYHKPIGKMLSDPRVRGLMSESTTFFLDDRAENFITGRDNFILIPPYRPPANVDSFYRDDLTLLQLRHWLLQPEVMDAHDVRKLDKKKIWHIDVSKNPPSVMRSNAAARYNIDPLFFTTSIDNLLRSTAIPVTVS